MADKRSQKDIHSGFKFWVEVDGLQVAGFSECSGLSIEIETHEHAEGGWNLYTHKLPGRVKYGNITLKRGLDPGQDLFKWFSDVAKDIRNKRKNVTITMYCPDGSIAKSWALQKALPIKWTGPDLKTDAGATAIESIEFTHEGLTFMPERSAVWRG